MMQSIIISVITVDKFIICQLDYNGHSTVEKYKTKNNKAFPLKALLKGALKLYYKDLKCRIKRIDLFDKIAEM